VVDDTTITATTPAHAVGAVAIGVITPGGSASQPNGFTYITVAPMVTNHVLELLAGTTGTVDLTQGATGGPFTDAAIVTLPAVSDGTASIVQNGGQWYLVYTAAANAASTVVVHFTLSNASATSLSGTVTFIVATRPDPSRDQEVAGLLNAQQQSTERFARAQIINFRDRLEQLHDNANRKLTSMDVRLGIPQGSVDPNASECSRENKLYNYNNPVYNAVTCPPNHTRDSELTNNKSPSKNESPSDHDLAFWVGGFVNFGTSNRYTINLDHTLIGVSGGVDYRFLPNFIAGIGLGYGRDVVDVGANGTRSNGQALSTAIYGSYHPRKNVFVDSLFGYSALDFGSKRFITSTNDVTAGDRSGNQVFGSLSSGYEYKENNFLVSSYGRIEMARTQLNAFTESDSTPYDLTFSNQTINMLASVAGLRTRYTFLRDWGALQARGRLEYMHDFFGSSWVSMGYADLNNGLPYSLKAAPFTRDYVSTGLGFDTTFGKNAMLSFDYTTAFGFEGKAQNHNFALRFSIKF
jgi:uncharacterized protein YhjY with autotransporter beta-barrel domain